VPRLFVAFDKCCSELFEFLSSQIITGPEKDKRGARTPLSLVRNEAPTEAENKSGS